MIGRLSSSWYISVGKETPVATIPEAEAAVDESIYPVCIQMEEGFIRLHHLSQPHLGKSLLLPWVGGTGSSTWLCPFQWHTFT